MAENKDEVAPETHEPVNEGADESMSRGNGWEVVSLMPSYYAASPDPRGPESVHEEQGISPDETEAEASRALFLSGHFAFPPSQHENLPIDEEDKEMLKEEKGYVVSEVHLEGGDISNRKEDENSGIPELNVPQDLRDIWVLDVKTEKSSLHDLGYVEEVTVAEVMYGSASHRSIHSGMTLGGSANLHELPEPLEGSIDPSVPLSEKSEKDDEHERDGLPSEAWWKKAVACMHAHAKETNAIWSIFVAAAVMGLVILRQQWQQERWQVLQQRWLLSLNTEKSGKAVTSLCRLKDIIISGSRRGTYISNGVSADH